MERKWLKKIKKGIMAGLLTLIMIFSNVLPVLAEEVPQPDISFWAIQTLNEAERYGIYPLHWYNYGFNETITEDKMQMLLKGTDEKLKALGLQEKQSYEFNQNAFDGSRKAVAESIYYLFDGYVLSEELTIKADSPIDFMIKKGIINGSDKGLELDSPATVEQAVVMVSRLIMDTCDALDGGSKGLFWKTAKGKNTVYLLGSIHVGRTDMYPLNKKIRAAFEEADALVVEANLLSMQEGMDYFIQQAMYQDGTTLKDNVSEATYEKCLQVFEKFSLPMDVYENFKPWSIANDLAVITSSATETLEGAAEVANAGIDMYFLSSALLQGKPIMELEGIRFQADLFNSIPQELQESHLNGILNEILNPVSTEIADTESVVELWQKQWVNGEIEDLRESYAASLNASEDEFTKALFGKRDENMTEKIIELLEKDEEGTYFVVVGFGHFVVEGMVIDQLEEKGYEVELVK